MKLLIVALFLALSGCGKIELVQPKPAVVKHQIDISELEKYFRLLCVKELTIKDDATTPEDETYVPSEAEVNTCMSIKIAKFLNAIT